MTPAAISSTSTISPAISPECSSSPAPRTRAGPVRPGGGAALRGRPDLNSTEMAVDGLGGHPVSHSQGTEVGLYSVGSRPRTSPAPWAAITGSSAPGPHHAGVAAHGHRPRHQRLRRARRQPPLRRGASVPGASPTSSRCRLHRGRLPGLSLAYIGDANNMCRSLAKAALMEGMESRVASPPATRFGRGSRTASKRSPIGSGGAGRARPPNHPEGRGRRYLRLYTDAWTSMGQDDQPAARLGGLRRFHHRRRVGRLGRAGRRGDALPARARAQEILVLGVRRATRGRQAAHRRTAMRGILAWSIEPPVSIEAPVGSLGS